MMAATPQLEPVFRRLRHILASQSASLDVTADSSTRYCLEAKIGPATLQAWRGKTKRSQIPVAWVEVAKASVSYHLMGVSIPSVQSGISPSLKARMQGQTCFHFKSLDDTAIEELDRVTSSSIAAFRQAGFIAE